VTQLSSSFHHQLQSLENYVALALQKMSVKVQRSVGVFEEAGRCKLYYLEMVEVMRGEIRDLEERLKVSRRL